VTSWTSDIVVVPVAAKAAGFALRMAEGTGILANPRDAI
jgi:hypothetical protein